MKKLFRLFIIFYGQQDSLIFWPTAVSIFLSLLTLAFWAVNLNHLPSQIPLFYSLPWGEPQLGSLLQFTILPSLMMMIILINLIILSHLHQTQLTLKRLLSFTSLLTATLFTVTGFKIILIFI